MFKALIAILLWIPLNLYAQHSITFRMNLDGQQGEINISEDGKISVSSSDFSPEFSRSLESALAGVEVHRDSIQAAQDRLMKKITSSSGHRPNIRFNQNASLNNPFIRNQYNENLEFEKSLSNNIFRPTFRSKILNYEIDFDVNEPEDRDALELYRKAQRKSYEQLGQNEDYSESNFTKSVIEIRQSQRGLLPKENLRRLSNLARGILQNNPEAILKTMDWLLSAQDFQKGFASSIVNNFNPASFLYPVDPNCTSQWCHTGVLLGDATSILIGAYEFMKGASLTLGGGGMTLALAGASGGTGGLSTFALPATAGATMAGIAMAGHGLNTMGRAFSKLYDDLETPENLDALGESNEFIGKTGIDVEKKKNLHKNSSYETIKEFYRTLKTKDIPSEEKKSLIRSFELDELSYEILKEDRLVYRWHNKDEYAGELGRFVSEIKISDPMEARRLLALPASNKTLYLDTYILKKNSKIFKGKVAPLNGLPGGGWQYYITSDLIKSLEKL